MRKHYRIILKPIVLALALCGLQSIPLAQAEGDWVPPIIYAPAKSYSRDLPANLVDDVVAVDNSGESLELRVVNYDNPSQVDFSGYQDGVYYVEYEAFDAAGNRGKLIRPIYVGGSQTGLDITSPELMSEPVTIYVGDYASVETFEASRLSVSAIDQEDGDITSQLILTQASKTSLDVTSPGHYLVEWYVTDSSGNPAFIEQTIFVK